MLKKIRRPIVILLAFLIASTLSIFVAYLVEQYNYQQKRLSIQKLSSSYVSLIRNNLFQAISATYPLAAFVRSQNGNLSGFEELATEMLPLYPGAASLQLQPDGIVKHIVPLKGNEEAIGHNILLTPDRNIEAFLARDSGKLTLAGPFDLIQGGVGAVARLPIYLENESGNKEFWGFSAVLFTFPEVLRTANLNRLMEDGVAYELSREHSDTNTTQIISRSKAELIEHPVIFNIYLPNSKWIFKVSAIKSWRSNTFIIIESVLGILFTLLFTFMVMLILGLRNNHQKLENLVSERTKDLADNLKRLDVALNVAHQGWFDINIQSREALVSDEFPVLLGYEPSKFKANLEEWKNSLHPENKEVFVNSLKQCMEAGKSIDIEYRRKTKDGSWVWLHSVGEIVEWDKHNNPKRMIGIHTDISERKRSDQVIRVLAEGGETDEGTIFKLMVKELASAQNASYAFIAQLEQDNLSIANTVAVWSNDNHIDNYSYALEKTPSQKVVEQGISFYPDNIQQLFPNDTLLTDIGAKSYLGVPLTNNRNEVIGLVGVLDNKPMVERSYTATLLHSLATRAAIELERLESDKKIKLSSKVFSNAHEGIMITDTKGTIIEVNPAFCVISGYEKNEVIGQTPRILNSGKQNADFYKEMWHSIAEQGHWHGEIWNRNKKGELYAELLTISSINDEVTHTVTHYIGLFSDITQSKEQQKTLELMAHYDELTQLPNRALFADRFSIAVARSKRTETLLAICFLDLDNFKPVNDNYGHNIGDLLLIEVAKRIKACIREEDTVSRQGGDEFALLLGNIETSMQCEHMLQRLHHSLAQPYIIEGQSINISASSGLTLYPNDKADLDTLIRHADQAMYQAKLVGKNKYRLFNTEQDQKIIQKHSQLDEIQLALSRDQFCLYYQPKVNMKTGEVFGAEALIRWMHPEKGLIPPFKFLPIIEDTELEILIGNWVINQALSQLEQWQKQDISIEVSVNVSSYHLQSPSFLFDFEKALAKYPNVSSKNFQLEILESSALSNLKTIRSIIKTCRDELGVNVALDDFGTGYSSLTHLRSLHANTIKIDQSFVRDMLDDPSDYAIIGGVIGLADSFNRDVIAEGVETTEHGLMLLMMDCYEAQGYGIARPMPAEEIPQWLVNYIPNKEWIRLGNKKRTLKETKIKLLRLTTEQWYKKFKYNVLLIPNNDKNWPITNPKKNHLGNWIQRARQEQLFDDNWISELDEVNKLMHQIAENIFDKYQQGELGAVDGGYKELQLSYEKMTEVLAGWK